jgi:hypothetical protein
MKRSSQFMSLCLAVFLLSLITGNVAYAGKPEIISHDAQYLDRQINVNLQWQSSESVISVRVAAGKEIKEIKVDPYDNKKNRLGYSGEVNVVLQFEPGASQNSIPYTIQLVDEDGLKSAMIMGKVAVPLLTPAAREEDQWGKEKLTSSQQSVQKDMIEQLRQVAQDLAVPPYLHDITVNNPGSGTVTFRTKATHSVALREINFRVFDVGNKPIDSQQISTTGKMWEGTSKDFSLSAGNYFVIAQALDGKGNTSQERKAYFSIVGVKQQVTSGNGQQQTPTQTQPQPQTQPQLPPTETQPPTQQAATQTPTQQTATPQATAQTPDQQAAQQQLALKQLQKLLAEQENVHVMPPPWIFKKRNLIPVVIPGL